MEYEHASHYACLILSTSAHTCRVRAPKWHTASRAARYLRKQGFKAFSIEDLGRDQYVIRCDGWPNSLADIIRYLPVDEEQLRSKT